MTKRTFTLILFIFFSLCSTAQNIAGLLGDDEKRLVRRAVDSSICIVKTDYQLKDDSGNLFSKKGREYFGASFFVGVLAERKLFFPSTAFKPWVTDASFEEFKQYYLPVLNDFKYRKFAGGEFTNCELSDLSLKDSGMISIVSRGDEREISTSRNKASDQDWLVWVTAEAKEGSKDPKFSLWPVAIGKKNSSGKIKPEKYGVGQEVIGGIMYEADYSSGMIIFKVKGVIAKHGEEFHLLIPGPEKRGVSELVPINKGPNDDQEKKSRKRNQNK